MINTIRSEYDHLLASPFLAKKDDPGVATIECTIGQRIFHKTFCDIGSGVVDMEFSSHAEDTRSKPEGSA